MAKNIHVVPHENKWAVRKEGSEKVIKITSTQMEATDYARKIAIKEGGEVVIHGRDGRIRDKDSYGRDPNPPKDTKY